MSTALALTAVPVVEKGETSLGSIGFFVGFLVYVVLSELIR